MSPAVTCWLPVSTPSRTWAFASRASSSPAASQSSHRVPGSGRPRWLGHCSAASAARRSKSQGVSIEADEPETMRTLSIRVR